VGAIKFNMDYNLRNRSSKAQIAIQPHEWGVLDDTFAQQNKGAFSRIIAADCYWMLEQHTNLVRTMQWFMAPGGKVWVVAGFHTGRETVARFFETAIQNGLEIERIFERDLIGKTEDGEQIRREWLPVREDEGPENRRRWAVVAVLKRKE
jgi:nicotinamide N-methyltransferase